MLIDNIFSSLDSISVSGTYEVEDSVRAELENVLNSGPGRTRGGC